ncbi:hypothetical protein DN584_24735, partial [Burkholderia multivorans]
MRGWWMVFALGVVVLQRQAALPGARMWVAGAAVLAVCAALYLARRRWPRCAKGVPGWALCAVAACVSGFGYAAARAEWRL